MRVMLIAGSFPPNHCGVGDYVAKLALALAELGGVRVAVLTQKGAGMDLPSEIEVLDVARSWRLSEGLALLGSIRRWKPDIVHIHYPSQGFYGRILPAVLPLACRAFGMSVVQTWHEAWPLRATLFLLPLRAGANGLIFVRPNYIDLLPRLLRRLVAKLPQTTVINAGTLPVSGQTPIQRGALRQRHLQGLERLVVFFGFLYPSKGVEQLFEIADPSTDALVIAGASKDPAYLRKLRQQAEACGWFNQVHYAGFLPEDEAANLLAAADAVVLPFLAGAGDWNTSVHGALTQGTLVITTAAQPTGDDPVRNLYTAQISNTTEMRGVLRELGGRRVSATPTLQAWARIARTHEVFYSRVWRPKSKNGSA